MLYKRESYNGAIVLNKQNKVKSFLILFILYVP